MRQTDILEVLQHFEGVKRCGDGQYMARCPCHDDRKQSLSIGRGEKGVVLKCQAGCDTRDIIARVGIKPRDLFYDAEAKPTERPQIVAVYEYPDGVQKLRKSDKSFSWRRPDGKGGWIYNRQGVPHSLYVAGSLGSLADPSAIDSNAVELMKTGVLTVDDYFGFADRYDGNPTMLKLIGHHAKEAADSADDRKGKVALTVLAQDCAKGTGKTLKAWDSMMTAANYCSGRGGSGNRRTTPGVTLSMGEWWEQLSGEIVENF